MFRPGMFDFTPFVSVLFLVLGVIGPLVGLVIVLSSTRGRTRQLGAWGAGLLLFVTVAHRLSMDLLRPTIVASYLTQLVFSLCTVAGIVLLARAVVVGFRAGAASAGYGPAGELATRSVGSARPHISERDQGPAAQSDRRGRVDPAGGGRGDRTSGPGSPPTMR